MEKHGKEEKRVKHDVEQGGTEQYGEEAGIYSRKKEAKAKRQEN